MSSRSAFLTELINNSEQIRKRLQGFKIFLKNFESLAFAANARNNSKLF